MDTTKHKFIYIVEMTMDSTGTMKTEVIHNRNYKPEDFKHVQLERHRGEYDIMIAWNNDPQDTMMFLGYYGGEDDNSNGS